MMVACCDSLRYLMLSSGRNATFTACAYDGAYSIEDPCVFGWIEEEKGNSHTEAGECDYIARDLGKWPRDMRRVLCWYCASKVRRQPPCMADAYVGKKFQGCYTAN